MTGRIDPVRRALPGSSAPVDRILRVARHDRRDEREDQHADEQEREPPPRRRPPDDGLPHVDVTA